jgi:hypothetical protein
MTKPEFDSCFQILASVPFKTQAQIDLKAPAYRKFLMRFSARAWLSVVDDETMCRESLKDFLLSPAEYYKMCQFKEQELRAQGIKDRPQEPNWKGMKMFLDACIAAGNKFAGQKIDGNVQSLGMCIGNAGNQEARFYEKMGNTLEKLAAESAARKAGTDVLQGSDRGGTEERDWADPES